MGAGAQTCYKTTVEEAFPSKFPHSNQSPDDDGLLPEDDDHWSLEKATVGS